MGRGCWAGPLVAAAVILPKNFTLEDGPVKSKLQLRDSKVLSRKQRETLSEILQDQALAIGLGWVWPVAIDASGITAAVKGAMAEALAAIKIPYSDIIIDGHINFLSEQPNTQAIIRADDSVAAVSAASIIAKVARDNYMASIAKDYPGYDFERHVGYGTAAHIDALKRLGVTPIHRRSYKPIAALL